MFGLIISGRPVDAAPQAITETQYAFRIPPNPAFHHIVVFLLPGTQLPPDTAATVYVQIPPSQDFKLLGGIGPGKESAIFKVSGVQSSTGSAGDMDAMTDDPAVGPAGGAQAVGGELVVGISIEPAAQVEAQLANLKSTSTAMVRSTPATASPVTTKVLAQRIIGNAFNFLASFGSDTVPLKAFEEWWKKFEKKVELDPSFLEREQG
jgi:protein Hikeshi